MTSTTIVYAAIAVFFLAALILWIWAFRELAGDTTFNEGSKKAWFWVVLLGPVGGSVAYLSAKKYVTKYSHADPARLGRLLEKDR
jgi:drug/metabolite transporter (DMT)-like permease